MDENEKQMYRDWARGQEAAQELIARERARALADGSGLPTPEALDELIAAGLAHAGPERTTTGIGELHRLLSEVYRRRGEKVGP
ncbi:MAG: hypothetical protein SF028_00490 [Candidatus Sumerlaeia bacterium]|nr:hypothetical protein [Candidatus Sumerlaeia bacterium]